MNEDKKLLQLWQDRLEKSKAAYAGQTARMVRREEQYKGTHDLEPVTQNDFEKNGRKRKTSHVWNITSENIESMIDTSVMMPKVIAVRQEDEQLAIMAENMLRNELDRLPMENINDKSERICKKQGGVFYLVEWDETQKTHTTSGANAVQVLHPQRVIPQDGVEEVKNMDYFFLLMPQTKKEIKRRYNVDVENEAEEMPELRGVATEEAGDTSEDLVTLNIAYYKNDRGGIGRIAFVGDTLCEHREDCMSRAQRVCRKCGQPQTGTDTALSKPTTDGTYPKGAEKAEAGNRCSYCGASDWTEKTVESRKVRLDELEELGVRPEVVQKIKSMRGYGAVSMPPIQDFIPQQEEPYQGAGEMTPYGQEDPMQGNAELGEIAQALLDGAPERSYRDDGYVEIPYYKPLSYPLILQRNVSGYGEFLGESDCDAIRDQQNTINRLSQKILDRIVKAGKKIVMPDDTRIQITSDDNDEWRMSMQDIAQLKEFEFTGNLQYEMSYMAQVYEESRRVLGITDSYQGRKDTTATSGKAKEFAAAQSAGRLESRKIMKKAAMEDVFRTLFENMLAYCTETRPIRYEDNQGNKQYAQWQSYAFLDVDEAGELYWNDNFLFSCDNASGLAANREAMWQEMTAHLQSGAFGNPTELPTLLIYWAQMETLHYPGAGKIKQLLQQRQEEEMRRQMQMAQMQLMQQAQPPQTQQAAQPTRQI